MFKTSRGQAFSIFKILMGAVFAVALLVIVYTTVSQYVFPYTGYEITKDIVLQATKSPGDCFSRDEVAFKRDEILVENLAFKEIDVNFDTSGVSTVFDCPAGECTVKHDINTPVSVLCSTPKKCTVYFVSKTCS